MSKVILICGKICSGKTTYAVRLCHDSRAVLLSVDEIMLAVFGQHAGDHHDEYARRIQQFLLEKSVGIIRNGIDVLLDWGFWTKQGRIAAKSYFRSRGIDCELHYIDISNEEWISRLNRRNADVAAGAVSAYYVDDNLASKFQSRFEPPTMDEIDVTIQN